MRSNKAPFTPILVSVALFMLLASCSGPGEATPEVADQAAQPPTVSILPTQASDQSDAAQPADDSPQADSLIFEDEEYGIQLVFPTSWDGYQVGRFEHDAGTNLCFSFPEASPLCVLQLDVYTKGAWAGLEKVHPDYYLTENDAFVFAAGPFTQECVQLDAFQCDRYLELPAILAGLEVQ